MPRARYIIECRKICGKCRREVDAVRVLDDPDLPGLRISRHVPPMCEGLEPSGRAPLMSFCAGSLDPVERSH